MASSPLCTESVFESPKIGEDSPPLVHKICKRDVLSIHRVEPVRVLHPVVAIRGFQGGVVDINIVKPHVRAVHDVDGPQWTLDDADCEYVLVHA